MRSVVCASVAAVLLHASGCPAQSLPDVPLAEKIRERAHPVLGDGEEVLEKFLHLEQLDALRKVSSELEHTTLGKGVRVRAESGPAGLGRVAAGPRQGLPRARVLASASSSHPGAMGAHMMRSRSLRAFPGFIRREASAAPRWLSLAAVNYPQRSDLKAALSASRASSRGSLVNAADVTAQAMSNGNPTTGTNTLPYGEWESPITARSITAGGIKLAGLSCDPEGNLRWLEGRPQEGGRQVVCSKGLDGSTIDMTPSDSNVRTRVHEYGGASYLLGPDGKGIIYSNFKDQRLYWVQSAVGAGEPEVLALTPTSAYAEDARYRFADCVLDQRRKILVCVREDHTDPRPSAVKNTICSVALDGSGEMAILAEGRDFYAAPRLSPDGSQLAYLCWDHPSMPWDNTELRVADLGQAATDGASSDTVVFPRGSVEASEQHGVSVLQPSWDPTGNLHFLADHSGFWNLYRFSPSHTNAANAGGTPAKENDQVEFLNLYPKEAEFSGAAPGWALGQQNYLLLSDGRVAACYADPHRGASRLVLLPGSRSEGDSKEQAGLKEFGEEEGLPRYFGGMCASPDAKTLYFLGGGPATALGIYSWQIPETGEHPTPAVRLLSSVREEMQVDPAYVSKPEIMQFPTAGGEKAYGYYYAPTNPRFKAPENGALPPLLVKAHGGPTAQTSVIFSPAIQFWTSRGFAVLDVDYRGSSGYGREYRMRLQGNWGVADTEDVCAGAQYLVDQGLVDPKRLAIDGGSAGGYTTLCALTFKDVFTAGCSMYGIGDLSALAGDTHKFESRYLDGLVGPYPEDKEIYEQRAPICHLKGLSCPILLLQGAEDKIVPPNQAQMMYDAVKSRGLPCCMKIYEGEQHGFRRSENIEDALNSELAFYGQIFGFQASAGEGTPLPRIDIANFKC